MSGHRKRKVRKWHKQGEITDCLAYRDLSPLQHLGCCTLRVDRVLSWQSRTTAGQWDLVLDTVKVDNLCFIDVQLFIQRCRPHHHHNLVPAVYLHPDADSKDAVRVYVLLFIMWKWNIVNSFPEKGHCTNDLQILQKQQVNTSKYIDQP